MARYQPLHTGMEMLSIAMAAMVFGIVWVTQKYRPNGRDLVLGLGLLGVAILDMGHSLSSPGMPDFITQNGEEKSILFWLAARCVAALALLCAAFWPQRLNRPGPHERHWGLLLVLLIVGSVLHVALRHPQWIPPALTPDAGPTDFKLRVEYGLIAAYVLAGLGFLARLRHGREFGLVRLALAAFTMAMGQFFFTHHAHSADVYGVAGHLYKIIAYALLYRGLFVETVQAPYQKLRDSEARHRAMLDTLPDLLFEVSRQGVYLSVHANDASKLAAPADQLLGRRVDEILPAQAAATCLEALAEAEHRGVTRGQRICLSLPSGVYHYELAMAKKTDPAGQEDSYLTLVRDITATVHDEQRIAFEARLNVSLLDLQRGDAEEIEADFLRRGIRHAERLTGSPFAILHFVHETRGAELAARSASAQPGDAVPDPAGAWQHKPATLHIQNRPPPGDALLRWMSLPVQDDGRVRMLLGVANKAEDYGPQDARALQALADAIWRRVVQLRQDAVIHRLSEALEQSPHQVVITDVNADILYVNRAFSEVSGYDAQEIRGRNPRMLQSGLTPRSVYEDMWRKLPLGLPWQGELINRRKGGQIYTEAVSLYPIRDVSGKVTHYVAHKEDITQRREAEERIRALSNFDTLTGLLNKKALDEQLVLATERADASHGRFSMLWFDLDNFKLINESLGHAAGDELLVEAANRLRSCLGPQNALARYSGDAFVAVVPQADQAAVALMAQEALRRLQTATAVQGHPVSVSASAGVAVYPDDARTAGTLVSAAELAMYRAKEDGRNGLRFFAPEMQAHTQRSLEMAAGLKDAACKGELFLLYQPQRAMDSDALIGAEALVRWRHPRWGLVSPAEFIPIAEQSGAITAIDFWVVEQTARQLRLWDAAGLPPLVVAVNVSAAQFARPQLADELLRILRRVNVSPQRIEVELTEAVALKHPELAETTIRRLHDMGFKVALDDFGTGYSSMSYLKRYAIDKLKIDQSFVRELAEKSSDMAIVTAIVRMAHSLRLTTLAEGVETAEQAALLRQCGCDEMQGYWYSKPLEPAAFEAFAKRQRGA